MWNTISNLKSSVSALAADVLETAGELDYQEEEEEDQSLSALKARLAAQRNKTADQHSELHRYKEEATRIATGDRLASSGRKDIPASVEVTADRGSPSPSQAATPPPPLEVAAATTSPTNHASRQVPAESSAVSARISVDESGGQKAAGAPAISTSTSLASSQPTPTPASGPARGRSEDHPVSSSVNYQKLLAGAQPRPVGRQTEIPPLLGAAIKELQRGVLANDPEWNPSKVPAGGSGAVEAAAVQLAARRLVGAVAQLGALGGVQQQLGRAQQQIGALEEELARTKEEMEMAQADTKAATKALIHQQRNTADEVARAEGTAADATQAVVSKLEARETECERLRMELQQLQARTAAETARLQEADASSTASAEAAAAMAAEAEANHSARMLLEEEAAKAKLGLEEMRLQRDQQAAALDKSKKDLARLRQHLLERSLAEEVQHDNSDQLKLAQHAERVAKDNLQEAVALQQEAEKTALRKDQEMMNLQTAMGQMYAEMEEKQRQLNDMLTMRAQLTAAEKASSENGKKMAEAQEGQQRAEAEAENALAVAKQRTEESNRMAQQVALMRKAMDQNMRKMRELSVESNLMVDRRIVVKLLVTFFERSRSVEVLCLMARMLGFSEEENLRVGLTKDGRASASSGGLFSRIVGGGPPKPGASAVDESLADMWVDFLMTQVDEADSEHGRAELVQPLDQPRHSVVGGVSAAQASSGLLMSAAAPMDYMGHPSAAQGFLDAPGNAPTGDTPQLLLPEVPPPLSPGAQSEGTPGYSPSNNPQLNQLNTVELG
ncbi:hypothetical protein CYMTET_51473 [Cymbomonas tetramitiformis]|uniref:GRIP domain-containing protein n=1 Tax=Cymbomonas tetramitiformis TaxID=36881 RepID=A0AAE0BMP4_9CHLO|nr:hypothetical protein CYMTET_51473 [Cymbomonas tetramitiformis]